MYYFITYSLVVDFVLDFIKLLASYKRKIVYNNQPKISVIIFVQALHEIFNLIPRPKTIS